MKYMKIVPFKGVDKIKLGSTKDDIKRLIGEPNTNNKEELEEGTYSKEWKYSELGIELYFIGSDRLDYIAVFSTEADLEGVHPIGMDINHVTKEIPDIKFEEDCGDGEALYIYEDKEITIWVKDGLVDNLTIFPKNFDEEAKNHASKVKSWGLSEAVEKEFTTLKYSYWPVWTASWLTWIYMVGGFAIGGYFIWPFLENSLDQKAIAHGQEIGGLMYDTNFGIGLLLFLFAWIVASALITGATVFIAKGKLKLILFFGSLDDDGGKPYNKKALRDTLKYSKEFPSAEALIQHWSKRYIHYALKWITPLLIIGIPILYQDMNSYKIYSSKGMYQKPFLPWEETGLKPWSDADYVELGCNQTDDGPSVVYDITFKDGSSKRIEDGIPFNGNSWLDSMETIDLALAEGGATFKRWEWMERDPMHPQCIKGYYSYLGKEDGDRLMKLLRGGKFE